MKVWYDTPRGITMSLRVRKNGRILCAAYSEEEPGDLYLDDYVHGYLFGVGSSSQESNPLHWYDWNAHEYFIDGRDRSSNAIRIGCMDCISFRYHPCPDHK